MRSRFRRVSRSASNTRAGSPEFAKNLDSPAFLLNASPRGVISSKNGYNVDEKVRIHKQVDN